MNAPSSWLFPSSMEEAKAVQHLMAQKVTLADDFQTNGLIGGLDVSHNLYDPNKMIYASAVMLNFLDLTVVGQACVAERQDFPYIPGFLGFREAPALVHAFNQLKEKPSILLVDGHGISHPRRLGIASHMGVLLDLPTIGVGKSILVGKPAGLLSSEPGSQVPPYGKIKSLGCC